MKAIWDNYFFDMDECGLTREQFAEKAGAEVRRVVEDIEYYLKKLDTKKVLSIIKEVKEMY